MLRIKRKINITRAPYYYIEPLSVHLPKYICGSSGYGASRYSSIT